MLFWKKKKPSYERAMDWLRANMVPGQGIIARTKQPPPYLAVAGYFIPKLYHWSVNVLSNQAMRYLKRIQNKWGESNGNCGKVAKYIASSENIRAVKYFLDAHLLKMRAEAKHA